jgi:hypothetical protein
MGIVSNITNFFKKDKKLYTHIDEDLIKRDEIIKSQQQKIASQDIQLAKIAAIEKNKRDDKKDKDLESERNKKLIEQKEDLKANKHGKIIWLGKFYHDLYVKRPHYFKKKPMEITDKDDEVVLGEWGDFGIMSGGKLCMKFKDGQLATYGKSLSHVLYKPDAFENMIRRGRFTIPMDKDGNFIEDIEYKEIPEPIDAEYDEETGRIKRIIWSKVKTSEVKKVIARLYEEKNYLNQELENRETLVIKLKATLEDVQRTLNTYRLQYDITQTQLSLNLNKFNESDKRIGDLHIQITKLTELKSMYENLLERKDSIIGAMMMKLEKITDPLYDRILESVKDDLKYYREILPNKVEVRQEQPIEARMPSQPGDKIRP